jgi:hypothetical protein
MLRPRDRLNRPTRQRLDAGVRDGAQETWVDRSELGLSEPSARWRWLCVLELLGTRRSAVGCSPDDSGDGVELAAREVSARLDEMGWTHRGGPLISTREVRTQ